MVTSRARCIVPRQKAAIRAQSVVFATVNDQMIQRGKRCGHVIYRTEDAGQDGSLPFAMIQSTGERHCLYCGQYSAGNVP